MRLNFRKTHRLTRRRAFAVVQLATVAIAANAASAGSASWAAAASGIWNSAPNWSPATIPNGAAENATISIAGTYTVTLNTNQNVNTLAINSANTTFSHSSGTLSASTINVSAGTYSLNGGPISGANISISGSGTFIFGNSSNNIFTNNTNYIGSPTLTDATLRLQSGGTWTGANATLTNSVFSIEQTATLTGKNVTMSGSIFAVDGGSTLTVAANSRVQGTGNFGQAFFVGGTNGVVNNGTITANAGGQLNVNPVNLTNNGTMTAVGANATLYVSAGSFTNAGTVEASGGGFANIERFQSNTWVNSATGRIRVADANSAALFGGNWSNLGIVTLNAGTLNLDGTFTRGSIGTINRTGGTIDILGFFDNSGGTLTLNATTGDYRLNGGLISGGTITSSGGGTLVFANNGSNRLANNATLIGDLTLNNASLRLQSGGTWTGATATLTNSILSFEYATTLTGKTLNLPNGTVAVEGGATLTVGSTSRIAGSGNVGQVFFVGGPSGLINNGTIAANIAGQALNVNPANLTNAGTLLATGAGRLNLNANTTALAGGLLGRVRSDGANSLLVVSDGTYTINAPAVATNGGLVYFQGTFTKAATFDASGRFIFDYTGAGNSPFAQIKADVISGFAGGAWNGPGINSSAAAGSLATGVGYAEASNVLSATGGTFAGVGVDGTAVLVRYTLRGDHNLDGGVNLDDFTRLAAGFGAAGVWSSGDSNYDGTVNLDDFTALAANFGLSLGADLPRSSAVPEPSVLAAILAGCCLVQRRRLRF